MIIAIYHKERWVYLACSDGSRTCSKERAHKFNAKDGEKMKEYMESLGFQVTIV